MSHTLTGRWHTDKDMIRWSVNISFLKMWLGSSVGSVLEAWVRILQNLFFFFLTLFRSFLNRSWLTRIISLLTQKKKKRLKGVFYFETLSFWKSFGDRTVHNTKKRRITIVELVSDFACFWAGHQWTLCWTFPIFNKARNSIQAFWGVPG